MGLSALKTALTSRVGIQTLIVKKHSPTILIGASAIGVVATVVLASRATLKMDEVLREAEEKRAKIEAARASHPEDYTDEDATKDGLTTRVQLAIKIAKLYAPAFAVGVFTVGAMTGSHIILSRRNAGITAAYAAVDKAFREYRGRVVNELGGEKDQEFRYGVVERQIGVQTDEGVAEITVKGADPEFAVASKGQSQYAKIFDEANPNWESSYGRNATFIRVQQQWANDLLNANGYLLLNDVYKMLGFKGTTAGSVVGWVKNNKRGGDGYVDFGVLDNEFEAMRFINGDERSVWLDFNVDGVVYDLIDASDDESNKAFIAHRHSLGGNK